MENELFLTICKEIVAIYTNEHFNLTKKDEIIKPEDFMISWSWKNDDGNKALLTTDEPNTMYYEIYYDNETQEICFEVYKKYEDIKFSVNKDESDLEVIKSAFAKSVRTKAII